MHFAVIPLLLESKIIGHHGRISDVYRMGRFEIPCYLHRYSTVLVFYFQCGISATFLLPGVHTQRWPDCLEVYTVCVHLERILDF